MVSEGAQSLGIPSSTCSTASPQEFRRVTSPSPTVRYGVPPNTTSPSGAGTEDAGQASDSDAGTGSCQAAPSNDATCACTVPSSATSSHATHGGAPPAAFAGPVQESGRAPWLTVPPACIHSVPASFGRHTSRPP